MTFTPTVRTQSDLERTWRTLMEPLGFGGHSVWLMLIDADDHPLPQLTQIEDAEGVPDLDQLAGFGQMLETLVGEFVPDGRVAFLISRPGRDGITHRDRDWAAALYSATATAGVPAEVVHLATDVTVLPVPMDEMPLPASA